MTSPTNNCCHPKQQQPQTTASELASVMQELRQRFDKPTNPNDVPVQPVLKEKQKEQLSFFQRKDAFMRECQKRFAKKILVRMQQRSAPQLLNGREKFSVKWCDRPSSQYGCQDTNSAPDFLTEKTKRETMEEPDDEEKLSEYCNEALIKSASTGNVNSLSTPVSVPTITRSASTGNLGSTGNFSSSTAQQQPMFSSSVMLEIPHSEVESVPSSILSSACLLSRLEARERMCKSCRRAGPQYDSFFGCRHTKSCPGLLEYPSEMMKFLVDCEDITGQRHPTFSTKRAMEIAEECDRQ
ncbi:unnamed protein product [Meloidogyne enterolobii]|uniref:Uncharacterized protein n=1 Tax=Meloidogyne enterolobii TaxID=390850 RepID=A0ACB0Z0R6_MELEN